jgi:hypothetical protein
VRGAGETGVTVTAVEARGCAFGHIDSLDGWVPRQLIDIAPDHPITKHLSVGQWKGSG